MAEDKIKFEHALLPTGWHDDVLIVFDSAGMITEVFPNSPSKTTVTKGYAIPGLHNVHSHAHQRLMAGLAEVAGPGTDSFWTWRKVMYGFALRLDPDDLEAVAAQLYVEMLKSGSTVVGEFQYLHNQPDGRPYDDPAELSLRCLAAAQHAGIALTLLPTLYAYGGFGGQTPAKGQRRFINTADSFLQILDRINRASGGTPSFTFGISPHSLRAVTKELLDTVIEGLNHFNPHAPIHIHVAEQTKEVDDCLAWSGRRPVDYLLDEFDVSDRWCAIHATHVTANETQRMANTGIVAGLCPTTEANLGDGTFAAKAFMEAGGKIAIGSDSHISVSPAEDLRQLEYSQRLRDRARNVLAGGPGQSTGRTLLNAVLDGGATVTRGNQGQIEPSCSAHIAVLDDNHPALVGRKGDQIIDSWIFSGGNACVSDVFVAGQHVVKERHHIRETEIAAAFAKTVRKLQQG